ncbi:hypothetical protein E2C01_066695 [Portunus trituberculatus]|uniref:Uncharacterized protein n=1 Tax=Portunus trituberculatus TaxID=210409 RepID=A0A5B7HIU4_PORTR|nr:hypothetical protein [Portunus trituberculatus]
MEPSSAARHMVESKHTPSDSHRFIETSVGLRKLTDDTMNKDFSGFRDEQGNMTRLINVERELRYMKEVMSSLMDKQNQLIMENTALKLRVAECEKVNAINQELKEEIQEMRKQNDVLKTTCQNYESSLKTLQAKVQDRVTDRAEGRVGDNKLKEVRNEWKQEQEEEKLKFSEVVRKQIQNMKVIKEKDDYVWDAVDKKNNFVNYGMKEKKIQINSLEKVKKENWPKL